VSDIIKTGLIAAILLLFTITIVHSESIRLDWDTAWKMALEHSEEMAAAKDAIAKARHQVGEAYAGAMPTVEANGIFQHYFKIPESIMILPPDMTGEPDDIRIKIKRGSENTAMGDIQLTQPLWLAGKIGIAVKLAKIYNQISQFGLDITRDKLRQSLVQTFYGAILADEYVIISHEAYAQAEQHREQAQRIFDQGMVSEYDLIRAGVAVANLRPQVIEALTGRDLAYKGLKMLIGLDVDQEIKIIGDLDQVIQPPDEYENAIKTALNTRPEFSQLGLQAKLYDGQYEIERRNTLWPNFMMNFKYETMASADDMKFGKYEFLGGFGGTLIMQVPLFDGWASSHRSQIARINKRAVLRQKNYLERGVKVEVFQALSDFRKAEEQLKAARETLAQAEKGQRIAEVRYREGVGTQLEWLDAELQVNNSKVNVLQAQFNLLAARAAYDRAVGK